MARGGYQYGTSPRKLQPEYKKSKQKRKTQQEIEEEEKKILEEKKQKRAELKQEKRRHYRNITAILGVFLIILAVSYRSSLITEKFNEIQDKKMQLAATEKTNEQLEVSLESSLNLSNIEKTAKEKLGMQKLANDQKVYVTLPKKDYTEASTKEIKEEKETNWFTKIINNFIK